MFGAEQLKHNSGYPGRRKKCLGQLSLAEQFDVAYSPRGAADVKEKLLRHLKRWRNIMKKGRVWGPGQKTIN